MLPMGVAVAERIECDDAVAARHQRSHEAPELGCAPVPTVDEQDGWSLTPGPHLHARDPAAHRALEDLDLVQAAEPRGSFRD